MFKCYFCSWVIYGISFYAILKLFKASAYRYPASITASFLEKLLGAGLPGQVSVCVCVCVCVLVNT